jgi:RHO1 GDP-GTP exchange protein 1/2
MSFPTPHPYSSPIMYPALLSHVAEAFRAHIVLTDIVKDGITYKTAFDGRQAVDKLAYIIRSKSTDRNLAALLGCALDAQEYFHAVAYDHRLRDSASDVYQFRTCTRARRSFHYGGLSPRTVISTSPQGRGTSTPVARPKLGVTNNNGLPVNDTPAELGSYKQPDTSTIPDPSGDTAEDTSLPTGVFTLLTDCYSPTCSRDRLCYSILCPRRLEQRYHLKSKLLSELVVCDLDNVKPDLLWIQTVPKEIADSLSDQEKTRQEAINEVIYTERNFVRDMEYLRDVCAFIPFLPYVLMTCAGVDRSPQHAEHHT